MIARLLLIFFSVCFINARAQISVADFLNSATEDPEVRTFQEQQRYLEKRPYQLSPLQRFEFRTQNRELITHQQEFALRITPSNPWEIRNNNRYFKSYQSVVALQNQMALKAALQKRYVAVITYLYYKELKLHLQTSQRLIRDQLLILQKQSGSSYFDADDFVDLQLDLMNKSVEIDAADFELMDQNHTVEQLINHPLSDSLTWESKDLISLDRIRIISDSITFASASSVLLAYQKQRIHLATSEYKLEKSNINTGFLQGEFDNRRKVQERNPINISFGVTIPIVNPNKGDMAKRQLDVIEATYDLEEARSEEESENVILQDKIERLIVRHQTLSVKLKEYEAGSLSKMLSTLQGGDPRVIVQFNENLVKLKILLSKLRRDALLNYITYMGISDKLEQQPLVNFLSPTLQKLE